MRCFFPLLFTILFLTTGTVAQKQHSLQIRLDSSYSLRLLRERVLLSDLAEPIDIPWKYDIGAKAFTADWEDLPSGNYRFKIKTIFADSLAIIFHLSNDTSIFIPPLYAPADLSEKGKREFKAADSIQIHYMATGCFHNTDERISLVKNNGKSYALTYSFDTVASNRIGCRTTFKVVPVSRSMPVKAGIIDDLFTLVRESDTRLKNRGDISTWCMSTSTQKLFIKINNTLFQFSDSGICGDWNMYFNWKKEFFIALAY